MLEIRINYRSANTCPISEIVISKSRYSAVLSIATGKAYPLCFVVAACNCDNSACVSRTVSFSGGNIFCDLGMYGCINAARSKRGSLGISNKTACIRNALG